MPVRHSSAEELQAGLAEVRRSPRDRGALEMIVRRPAHGEREVLQQGRLDADAGLVGDNWSTRGSSSTADGRSHPGRQLTIMSSRVAQLVAGCRDRWPLAGDQLYVDLDLSRENLPAGTRLAFGEAPQVWIEVTAEPHTGCKKFVERFGIEAMKLVSSPLGRELNLRGVNARVVEPGVIRVGEIVRRM